MSRKLAHITMEIMMKKYLLAAALTSSLSNFALAQEASQVTAAPDFVPKAAMSDLFEIKSGELAASKSQSPEVKKAGQELVMDHTKSSMELEALAKQTGVAFEKPIKLDKKHQQMIDNMVAADDKNFDEAFKGTQVQAHKEGIILFKSYSEGGDHPQLKQFATKTLPVLEHHLQMVEQIKPQ
jgi:putative membrane protein